ncbi:hypothetical protein BJX99DRAFT_32628 [Aspergillus californicus]
MNSKASSDVDIPELSVPSFLLQLASWHSKCSDERVHSMENLRRKQSDVHTFSLSGDLLCYLVQSTARNSKSYNSIECSTTLKTVSHTKREGCLITCFPWCCATISYLAAMLVIASAYSTKRAAYCDDLFLGEG